jgi:hypothetical protein
MRLIFYFNKYKLLDTVFNILKYKLSKVSIKFIFNLYLFLWLTFYWNDI